MAALDHITAFVLADGPAVLEEILGRPRLYHLLDRLADAGIARAVFCAGPRRAQLEAFVGARYRGLALAHADCAAGDAASLRQALSAHPSPLALVADAERLATADLAAFAGWFSGRAEAAGLLLARVEDAAGHVRAAVDCSGAVTALAGEAGPGPGFVSAGLCLLRPGALDAVVSGESFETGVLPGLAAAGRLCALETRARLADFRLPGGGAAAARMLAPARGENPRAAVFLDRDGTVIVDKHYLHEPEGVELLPGAAQGLRRMMETGRRLVLVSNQSGVGRGYFGRGDVERVNGRLLEVLAEQGVRLDALYACPHAPEEACGCRKPMPGLIERACADLGLDPAQSFVIGDKPCDVDLGLAVGAQSVLVRTGSGQKHAEALGARGIPVAGDLAEAAAIIAANRG